jgi:hypothetical protein
MTRCTILAFLGLLFLGVGPLQSSATRGHYREPSLNRKEKRGKLPAGEAYEFRDTFRANQRACVIVEGDHNPPMNLTVKVFDAAGNLVAVDSSGGDFVAVMWYPPRMQDYRISITSDGNDYNDLDIVVK